MAEAIVKNFFPSQVVADAEKASEEYGLKVAKAIEQEWFNYGTTNTRFASNQRSFHTRRLYARGEQPVQKYKDELSINGDLSYLNLDWTPVPIVSKFVDIVANGISERSFNIRAYSQDPYGMSKRTKYMESILRDMNTRELSDFSAENFGIDLYENDKETLPDSQEELDLHMQLSYKQAVEIAEEQAIKVLMAGNKYDLIKKRVNQDLTVLGMGCVKNTFNHSEGVKVDYVDPADIVYSYTDSPYFEDVYYVGEVKTVPINELAKEFPTLTNEELKEIIAKSSKNNNRYGNNINKTSNIDSNSVQMLYFNYKTYSNEVYKIKTTASGAKKAIEKTDSFNPPKESEGDFEKLSRSMEVLYEGALVLGTSKLLKWEMAKNMIRPKSDSSKVKMNYSIVAPRMYKGKIESLVSRIIGFADMIQLTHLKLQQVLSRMIPDGVYLDADGLAEVDLGNGTNYNPQEALNMFFQTGSVIGRSFTQDGDMNPGKVPIQEIASGSGGAKLSSLIQTYNYYLQMIRDVTGLNEARDGSTPDRNALVGIQKIAAANSNTATRHILQSSLHLTSEVAESISLRISDILEYSPSKDAFIQKIGGHNVAVLEEISNLHLYDFGIFLELAPDDEEKAVLENNIQQALAQKSIDLEDAIDLREIRNIKLANQLLKIRRKKKGERDQLMQQQNIQAQAQANAQAQQVAAQAEVQKSQALAQTKVQVEQSKAQFEIQKMQQEAEIKKGLMEVEFQYNMQLAQVHAGTKSKIDEQKEDRKDKRTKIQATQQSELIEQRQKQSTPKNFESAGMDNLGGFGLEQFSPR
jgi:hypothetical protein